MVRVISIIGKGATVVIWLAWLFDCSQLTKRKIQQWNRGSQPQGFTRFRNHSSTRHPSTRKNQSGGKRPYLGCCNRESHFLIQFPGLTYFRNSEPLKWKEGCIPLTKDSDNLTGLYVPLPPLLQKTTIDQGKCTLRERKYSNLWLWNNGKLECHDGLPVSGNLMAIRW